MQLNAITRKSALPALLLLMIILIATAVRSRIAPFSVEEADSCYLGRVISLILSLILLFGVGVIEGKTLPRSGLNKSYNTLPIPIYGLLACGIFFTPNTLPTAIAALCFALALYLLLHSLHRADEQDSLLSASILLGAMPLLYPPSVTLAATIPLAILILALSLRQALIFVIGYITPLFTASYIVWYRGDSFWQLFHNLAEAITTPQMDAIVKIPYVAIIILATIATLLIGGFLYAVIRPDKIFLLVRIRRSLHLFIWVSILSLAMVFIPSCDISVLAIAAVPLTILLCFVLEILPNNFATIAYWVLLLLFVLHLFVE